LKACHDRRQQHDDRRDQRPAKDLRAEGNLAEGKKDERQHRDPVAEGVTKRERRGLEQA
jgi:hypothetical protein